MARLPQAPSPGSDRESEDRRQARSFGKYAGVGLQFAVSIIAFLYAGQWVDGKLGTAPWGMIVGVFTGGGAAFYSMYRKLMVDLKREEDARRK
ncbi:MAG: AtpZ/AtpI family protein [Gemmatimonadaceae bacterium]